MQPISLRIFGFYSCTYFKIRMKKIYNTNNDIKLYLSYNKHNI